MRSLPRGDAAEAYAQAHPGRSFITLLRAHAFLCLLAEHVVFHLRAAWAPRTQKIEVGALCHSFRTLLTHLATLTRNTIHLPAQGDVTLEQLTQPTAVKRRAFELLGAAIPLRFK